MNQVERIIQVATCIRNGAVVLGGYTQGDGILVDVRKDGVSLPGLPYWIGSAGREGDALRQHAEVILAIQHPPGTMLVGAGYDTGRGSGNGYMVIACGMHKLYNQFIVLLLAASMGWTPWELTDRIARTSSREYIYRVLRDWIAGVA